MTTEERVAKIMGDGRFAMDAMLDVPIREAIASEIRAALEERDRKWCIAVVAGSPDPSVVQAITTAFCEARARGEE